MKKVGFFGGTYDPIHFGHLNLAVELFEKKILDEILFAPTSLSPLRTEAPPLSSRHRAKMVELAIDDHPYFTLFSEEINGEEPAFTIDTIMRLKTHHSKLKFFLILGEDTLLDFDRWKEPDRLIREVSPLIGSRSKYNILDKIDSLSLLEETKKTLTNGLVETTCFDISGTEIRKRLSKGLYCYHLVPRKVLDYIYENQLYFCAV
ncbi:MAG: nicotinate (nicotinamide) nucleotide adenylyltransferase [Chlamydiia bacterium]|nr:nicotinate (nicotinamide) nucleotide adenylyltransferase [Chlamydiia bacterium]